jgi:Holliday junction DNA helicase RuvA
MYDFIEGTIEEISPSHVVIQAGGIGYYILISLNSYAPLQENFQKGERADRLFIHQTIREDAHLLYGFKTRQEREIFRLLISVSGVGTNTARLILSSLKPLDVQTGIAESDASIFKSVKGVGTKTAERIIVDLRNKVDQILLSEQKTASVQPSVKEEAMSALTGLGFLKAPTEKVLAAILSENPECTIESLVRLALKRL